MDVDKRLESCIRDVKDNMIYAKRNKEIINDFIKSCKSKGLTKHRTVFYLAKLKKICEIHRKNFDKWGKEDVELVMEEVNKRGYKQWTIEDYKCTLKVFFRWLNNLDPNDPSPKIVSWMTKETPQNGLRREDLLTRDEITRIINAAKTIESKALISVLAAGPRPSEVFSIRLKDVRDEGEYIKMYVRGKMHKKMGERQIYIGFFMRGHQDFVRMWLREHPGKGDSEKRLFPGLNNENMRMRLIRFAERAGIEKKVWPYLIRHVFGTWAYGHYEGAYARRLLGHAAGSKMESVYCHLSESDLVDRLMGKKTDDEKPQEVDKMEIAREVLNIMAKMPEYGELALKAVDIWRQKKDTHP